MSLATLRKRKSQRRKHFTSFILPPELGGFSDRQGWWWVLVGQPYHFQLVAFLVAQHWHISQGLGEGCSTSWAFVGHRTPGASSTKAMFMSAGSWPLWRQSKQAGPGLADQRVWRQLTGGTQGRAPASNPDVGRRTFGKIHPFVNLLCIVKSLKWTPCTSLSVGIWIFSCP